MSNIKVNLQMLIKAGLMTQDRMELGLKQIHPGTQLKDIVTDVDLVIESVFENLEIKQTVFQELDKFCPEHTIFASNTSTLMPSQLASATQRPDRVLVTHYFNPPYLLPLVEVVRNSETSDNTITTIIDLLTKIGKRPALIQKEAPGFIGNRLQGALIREALSIVKQGIASPQDVDIVVKNGFGRRLANAGVFEIFEIAGWDLILAIWPYLIPYIENSIETPSLLQEKVDTGELGLKTEKGFYDWTPESSEALKKRLSDALIKIAQWS